MKNKKRFNHPAYLPGDRVYLYSSSGVIICTTVERTVSGRLPSAVEYYLTGYMGPFPMERLHESWADAVQDAEDLQ